MKEEKKSSKKSIAHLRSVFIFFISNIPVQSMTISFENKTKHDQTLLLFWCVCVRIYGENHNRYICLVCKTKENFRIRISNRLFVVRSCQTRRCQTRLGQFVFSKQQSTLLLF